MSSAELAHIVVNTNQYVQRWTNSVILKVSNAINLKTFHFNIFDRQIHFWIPFRQNFGFPFLVIPNIMVYENHGSWDNTLKNRQTAYDTIRGPLTYYTNVVWKPLKE